MIDLMLYETGDGGDISLENGYDIAVINGLTNQVYLAFFGGNTEAVTDDEIQEGEQRFDWWGNSFEDEEAQFNSRLEKALNETPITSGARGILEDIAKKDLEFLQGITQSIDVNITLTDPKRVTIDVQIVEREAGDIVSVRFVWDNTKKTVIEFKNI